MGTRGLGDFSHTSRLLPHIHTNEPKRLGTQCPGREGVPPFTSPRPHVDPACLAASKSARIFFAYKCLPIWQFLTSTGVSVTPTPCVLFPDPIRLANTPHEDEKTIKLFTFIPPSLGSLANGARASFGVEERRGHHTDRKEAACSDSQSNDRLFHHLWHAGGRIVSRYFRQC